MAYTVSPTPENVPQPAVDMPPATALDGKKGTDQRYALADHTHASLVQRAAITTAADGTVTWVYARPITCAKDAVPVVQITPEDGGTPIAGQITGRVFTTNADGKDEHTAVKIKAFRSRPLPATLLVLGNLVAYDVFGIPAQGVKLNVIAAPPTQ
jgi:hypothetical protein